ncbi:hypothetical protein JAAARDRAFT_31661 [Jaapia argillacea MUCL 33604]|uniref:Succinyl-CoA:3-ketoacid-coenzyme A transferase n=1 Tax=Jaapia argillacea MUCL 33604 TaxID=933084 RepID=A0A067QAZ6_9AGAM|nr:hypothetical protein JAAARDRAFT_31661 [Jaapia argillacea MUCL 33604]
MLALKRSSRTSVLRGSKVARAVPVCIRFYSVVAEAVPNKKKVWESADEAIKGVKSGDIILSGGFGVCGIPETLLDALSKRTDVDNLTAVSNNAGAGDHGLVKLLKSKQLDKLIISYLGGNKFIEQKYLQGEVSLELAPQGTLAERMRAHAAGIPAFYTPTGASSPVEEGSIPIRFKEGGMSKGVAIPGNPKEVREFNGRRYVMEPAIVGDVALVHAWKVDEVGNCVFRYAANNFNAAMARNAKLTIVEAEEIVPVGSINANEVHLPGIYVDRIVPATEPKAIESLTLAPDADAQVSKSADPEMARKDLRHKIAARAAKELSDGFYVNLGVGMPTLVTEYMPAGAKLWLQSENGILGMGPFPTKAQVDADVINAGKETVTLLPGASVFDSSESFAMIRGGHIDVAILGAMEVSQAGDIANFMVPGKLVKGIGGAMDLVSNPDKTKVIVVMQHCAKDGSPKIRKTCTLPLTGARAVSQIITEKAVFLVDRKAGELELIEIAEGLTLEQVKAETEADFKVREPLGRF